MSKYLEGHAAAMYCLQPEIDRLRAELAESRKGAEASNVVLDAIRDVLTEAGYDLPLSEQVGAVIQDRDAANYHWSSFQAAAELYERQRDESRAEVARLMPFLEHMARANCMCQMNGIQVRDNYHVPSCMVGKAQETMAALRGRKEGE